MTTPGTDDLRPSTIADATVALAEGRFTALALVESSLTRIDDPSGEGSRTFLRRFPDAARASARADDLLRSAGLPRLPLSGVPISIKDLFDVEGSVTLAGSRALAEEPPARADAPVVARLRRAGAAIVGTTNMTEFAMGSPGTNRLHGTPRNPYDRDTGRIPGGSSSGAAVSVTDGMALGAIGSDTAGSVRVPAALCGLAGFKPTARRVPLDGTIPLAWSVDSIGPLAHSVGCCALLDAVIAGQDRAPSPGRTIRGLRFGLPRQLVLDDLQPPVAAAFEHALTCLSENGALVIEFDFHELADMAALTTSTSFAVVEGYAWHRPLLARRGDHYDPLIASRLRAGAQVSAADYIALTRGREALAQSSARTTATFDAVLMPTVQIVAPPIGDVIGDDAVWLATNRTLIRNPGIANFLDRCALTLPCHPPGSAPVGLTLMGESMRDREILSIGMAVERAVARSCLRT